MRDFTKEWLKAAVDDLITIDEIIDNISLTHVVAFHSQQCIEKIMKALVEEYEIDIPKIHKLVKLNVIIDNKLDIDNVDMLKRLDTLYIESRYPGDMGLLPNGKPTLEEAKEFCIFSKDTFEKVCKILKTNKDELI